VIAVGLQRGGDFTGSYVGLSARPPLPIVGKKPSARAIALWTAVLIVVVLVQPTSCGAPAAARL
jgi:branched-chain amino acid transport system permease protein